MNKSNINVPSAGTKVESSTTAQNQHVSQPNANTNVSGSFTIIDWCKCKCGQEVSPSQCDSMAQILFSDDREYIVGFECWQCSEWIPFPKNCR
jgi:hypothetical protein